MEGGQIIPQIRVLLSAYAPGSPSRASYKTRDTLECVIDALTIDEPSTYVPFTALKVVTHPGAPWHKRLFIQAGAFRKYQRGHRNMPNVQDELAIATFIYASNRLLHDDDTRAEVGFRREDMEFTVVPGNAVWTGGYMGNEHEVRRLASSCCPHSLFQTAADMSPTISHVGNHPDAKVHPGADSAEPLTYVVVGWERMVHWIILMAYAEYYKLIRLAVTWITESAL